MKKDLDYYLSLPWSIEIKEDPNDGYFVQVKELEGCVSQGETKSEAEENIVDALKLWIESGLEDKQKIPEPV